MQIERNTFGQKVFKQFCAFSSPHESVTKSTQAILITPCLELKVGSESLNVPLDLLISVTNQYISLYQIIHAIKFLCLSVLYTVALRLDMW